MKNKDILLLLKYSPYILLAITFGFNVSWNISDHDDGLTLAYHAFGRDSDVQKVYGFYDSMCDYLLGFLPQNYYLVFATMITTSFLFSLLNVFLLKKITTLVTSLKPCYVDAAALVFLLAMPEYLYMCFSFKSIAISLFFILLSFYILISPKVKINFFEKILLSAIVFGLGVSFRWNLLQFGLVVFVSFAYHLKKINLLSLFRSLLLAGVWGGLSLLASLTWIYVSGYSLGEIIQTIVWGKEYALNTDFSFIVRVADSTVFLTPASVLLIAIGIYHVFTNFNKNTLSLLIFFISIISYLYIGMIPSFKYLSLLWLLYFLLFSYGIFVLYHSKKNKILIIAFSLLLFTPWFIGVQINTDTTNWGPGMNIKIERSSSQNNERVDDRFNLDNMNIVFKEGFALPTSEGIRPLYGHFYALFGGKLKRLDKELNQNAVDVITYAKENHAKIFVDRMHPYLFAAFFKNGYRTSSPYKSKGFLTEREYKNDYDDVVREVRFNNPKNLLNIDSIYNQLGKGGMIAYFTYTNEVNILQKKLKSDSRFTFKRIGPFTCTIDKR